MNIYQKLATARVELQDMKLKKTGKNQTMSYYELGDILPAVNGLCKKHDMMTRLNIVRDGVEKAVLTVYNATDPNEKLDFVCPTAEAQLPRGQEIQNLGAKITYLRRYMLMTAFEIVESDMVDKVNIDLTDEVSEEDQKKVRDSKDMESLTKICGQLKSKYKYSLITPIYDEMKVKLDQKESKA